MFTGLVEVLGKVAALEPLDNTEGGGSGTSLLISNAKEILSDAQLGDSICVNGTCLTVTALPSPDSFKVGIAPETLRRTNLGDLKQGDRINLERSLLPHTRMGGHFVQGHVDTIATIAETRPDGNAITFRLQPREKAVLKYIVEKGYVALDGASLTITAVDDAAGWFEIMLIAYTQDRVVMAKKGQGAAVNVEVDMVGKYAEKSIAGFFESMGSSGSMPALEKLISKIMDEKLSASKA